MLRYLLRRFILLAITLLLTSVVIFGLTQLLPGDVARLILGRDARPEALANLREELGLNDPVPLQYVNWLTGFVSGDWGTSFTGGRAADPPARAGSARQFAAPRRTDAADQHPDLDLARRACRAERKHAGSTA